MIGVSVSIDDENYFVTYIHIHQKDCIHQGVYYLYYYSGFSVQFFPSGGDGSLRGGVLSRFED